MLKVFSPNRVNHLSGGSQGTIRSLMLEAEDCRGRIDRLGDESMTRRFFMYGPDLSTALEATCTTSSLRV